MRPDNIRRSVTLYTRWTNTISNMTKSFRRVLTNVYFEESSNVVAQRTGNILNQDAFYNIFVQDDLIYVPIHEWIELPESELDGKFSIDNVPATQSFIVPYVIEREFSFSGITQALQQENAFITTTPGVKRISKLNDNRRGTFRAQYLSVRC